MDLVCHRCGATLISTPELFCPHCGAPQLRFESTEEQTPYQGDANGASPRAGQLIAWRPAVHAALIVALPVGILSSLLDFGILWVLAGGFAAVALYQRKAVTIAASLSWPLPSGNRRYTDISRDGSQRSIESRAGFVVTAAMLSLSGRMQMPIA